MAICSSVLGVVAMWLLEERTSAASLAVALEACETRMLESRRLYDERTSKGEGNAGQGQESKFVEGRNLRKGTMRA